MPQMGMTFFPPGCRGGNIRIAVKGAKKAPLWKVPCQPGLLLDTVLSISLFTGKEQNRANFVRDCANFVPEKQITKYIKKNQMNVIL